MMLSSFFKFSIAFHSDFLKLFLTQFALSCSTGNCCTVLTNLSKLWFLPLGGIKLLLLATMDVSSFSLSKKKSASRNRLQNASASFLISSVFFVRGVGVNLSPFSSTLISFSVKIRLDKLITLISGFWSFSIFCAILCRFVWGHILKKNFCA